VTFVTPGGSAGVLETGKEDRGEGPDRLAGPEI
jgi:hypothetical protein